MVPKVRIAADPNTAARPSVSPKCRLGKLKGQRMRVCFLSFAHRFDDTRVLHKEAHALTAAGFDVVHVAPAEGVKPEFFSQGVKIVLYPKRPGWTGKLRRFVDIFRVASALTADCYHCNEVESWVVGCLLKLRRKGTRVVFDVHEHYPSRAAEPHFPRWFRLIGTPAVRLLFKLLTPWTDHIVLAKRSLKQDFRSAEDKVSFVFNYAPLRLLPPVPGAGPDMPTAVHVGGMSRPRGWPQLLEALAALKNKGLKVLLLGEFQEGEEPFAAEARRLGVFERVSVLPRVPYGDMFACLQRCTVGLMLYQPGILNHVYAFPMKMYDYMLAGLPLIAPAFSVEVAPVVHAENCGLLVDPSDPASVAHALDWICEHPQEAAAMGRRGRDAVLRKYNWEQEAEKLVALYASLSARPRGRAGQTPRSTEIIK